MIKNLSRNQTTTLLLGCGALVILIIVVLVSKNTPKVTDKSNSQSPDTFSYSLPDPATRPKQTDDKALTLQAATKTSQTEKQKIISMLPLFIKSFPTSVGINTDISVFTIPEDPAPAIHLEIYGVEYQESTADLNNPQAKAFVESFLKVKNDLSQKNINLKNLQIIYSNRQFAQDTALNWIQTFKLLD